MKKKLIGLLQLAFGIGLIVFLLWRMDQKGELKQLTGAFATAGQNWPIVLLGFSCFFWSLLVCTMRWKLLLDAQDLRLPFLRVSTLYYIGHFFSGFLPGVTSGDFVKAIYAAREAPHKRTAAVSTVFIDRIIGLLGLVIPASILMLVRLDLFLSNETFKIVMWLTFALCAAMVGGFFVMFRQNLLQRWALFRRLESSHLIGSVIAKAYETFRVCVTHRGVLTKTVLLSIFNHFMFIVCIYFLGLGLEIRIPFVDYLTAFVIVNAVAAIPITPGGLGTRDVMAITILGFFGVAKASAFSLSLMIYASMLGWSLIGGIVYIVFCLTTTGPSLKELQSPESNP